MSSKNAAARCFSAPLRMARLLSAQEFEGWINVNTLRSATLMNPRNAYQNYNVAVNCDANRTILHPIWRIYSRKIGN